MYGTCNKFISKLDKNVVSPLVSCVPFCTYVWKNKINKQIEKHTADTINMNEQSPQNFYLLTLKRFVFTNIWVFTDSASHSWTALMLRLLLLLQWFRETFLPHNNNKIFGKNVSHSIL